MDLHDRRRAPAALTTAACALIMAVTAGGARAQTYPDRPIVLVVPNPPGGTVGQTELP